MNPGNRLAVDDVVSTGYGRMLLAFFSGMLLSSRLALAHICLRARLRALVRTFDSNSAFFDDEGVKLGNTASLTALAMTINVQNTGGLSFNGQYNTVGGQIIESHSSTSAVITYRFNLQAGQTLSPGTNYLFDAQMAAHGTAHPTSGDTFTVIYTTGGQTFTQSGHF